MSLAHSAKKYCNRPATLAVQTLGKDKQLGLLPVIDVVSWISDYRASCAGCGGADRKNNFGCCNHLLRFVPISKRRAIETTLGDTLTNLVYFGLVFDLFRQVIPK